MENLSKQQQLEACLYIQETFNNYKELGEERKTQLTDIYEGYRSFQQKKTADWSSSFKVNKAHEIVNKVLPRIIAKNPRWLVSKRTEEFIPEDKLLEGQAKKERMKKLDEMALGVQDYLTYIFDRYNLRESLRLWAKNMLIYGNGYAKIKYKYETARIREEGGKVTEKVIGEYPSIDVKSYTDIYVDPRYILLEDMPGIIERTCNVRFADLKRKKDKYFNLDLIEDLPNEQEFKDDENGSKSRIYEITGIPVSQINGGVDKNTLTIQTFYGKYALDGEEEQLYRMTTVNDMIMIECEEITCIPFEDIKCFDDSETHYAVGLVEPILSLQDELNFKKNSASEYINQTLNRSWIWSPNSGINPADLNNRPNNILATTKDAITAQNNLIELAHRPLDASYFSEQNDIERQIQAQTFTVDTSANKSNQALTNTATGIRIKFFESNTVIDELRKHFEEGLEKLAYKLLESTFENMEDNIVIKKLDDSGFWEINKELLRDAFNRYSIKVEVNSSSFDDIENRREDAIAFFNMLVQGANAGVQINFDEAMKEIINTFEKKDATRFIKQEMPQLNFGQGGNPQELNMPGNNGQAPGRPTPGGQAGAITEQVAKGALTSGIS